MVSASYLTPFVNSMLYKRIRREHSTYYIYSIQQTLLMFGSFIYRKKNRSTYNENGLNFLANKDYLWWFSYTQYSYANGKMLCECWGLGLPFLCSHTQRTWVRVLGREIFTDSIFVSTYYCSVVQMPCKAGGLRGSRTNHQRKFKPYNNLGMLIERGLRGSLL